MSSRVRATRWRSVCVLDCHPCRRGEDQARQWNDVGRAGRDAGDAGDVGAAVARQRRLQAARRREGDLRALADVAHELDGRALGVLNDVRRHGRAVVDHEADDDPGRIDRGDRLDGAAGELDHVGRDRSASAAAAGRRRRSPRRGTPRCRRRRRRAGRSAARTAANSGIVINNAPAIITELRPVPVAAPLARVSRRCTSRLSTGAMVATVDARGHRSIGGSGGHQEADMDMRRTRWFWSGAVALGMALARWRHGRRADPGGAGSVRVVHGLRGLVADVYLDGTLVLPTFQPERSTDPLPIPAGDHLVEIRSAGAAMTETPLLTQTVTVPAGFVGSLVAHLDGAGEPTLTAFADDLTAVPAGESRVVVRHAAAAEPVAVLLNDQATFTRCRAGSRGRRRGRRRRLRGRGDAGGRWRAARRAADACSTPTARPTSCTSSGRRPTARSAGRRCRSATCRRRRSSSRPATAAPRTTGGSADAGDHRPRRGRAGGWWRRSLGARPPLLTAAVRRALAIAALVARGSAACGGEAAERVAPSLDDDDRRRRPQRRRRRRRRRRARRRRALDDDHRRPTTVAPTTPTGPPIVTHARRRRHPRPGRRRRAGRCRHPGARRRPVRSLAVGVNEAERARHPAGRPHAGVVPPRTDAGRGGVGGDRRPPQLEGRRGHLRRPRRRRPSASRSASRTTTGRRERSS